MIDDATVKRLVEKHTTSVFIPIDVFAFAKACFAAGQDAQRESDVNKNTSKAYTSPSATPPTIIQADGV